MGFEGYWRGRAGTRGYSRRLDGPAEHVGDVRREHAREQPAHPLVHRHRALRLREGEHPREYLASTPVSTPREYPVSTLVSTPVSTHRRTETWPAGVSRVYAAVFSSHA